MDAQFSYRRRGGVASMLVIIVVAIVTVMVVAFMHGQDSAPDVSDNLVEAAEARCIAESGADITAALLQVESIDWRTAHTNGVVAQDIDIGDGRLSIQIYDLEGKPPTSDTEWAVVKCVASVGALKQSSVSDIRSPRRPTGGADIDLSEFAIFAHETLTIDNGRVTRWYRSPRGRLGKPNFIGANATAANSVNFYAGSRLIDVKVCVQQQASASVIRNNTSFTTPRVDLTQTEAIPVPGGPTPNVLGMKRALLPMLNIVGNQSQTLVDDRRYFSARLDAGATLRTTTSGGRRIMLFDDKVEVLNGSTWISEGNLDLIVLGDLIVKDSSAITVPEGSRLRIFAGGAVKFDGATLGFSGAEVQDVTESQFGVSVYQNPGRIELWRLPSLNSSGDGDMDSGDVVSFSNPGPVSWKFVNRSMVCGSIYGATSGDIIVDNDSGVFGRLVGRNVSILSESSVHYDHVYDERLGYTNPTADLYAAPMDLDETIKGYAVDLNDATLASIEAYIGPRPGISPDDGVGPSPRDKDRVAHFKVRQVGLRPREDSDPVAEKFAPRTVSAGGGN